MRQKMTGFGDGSGTSWTICKQSAPRSRETTTPTPHHSIFYRPDALPDAQPTVSKQWRHTQCAFTALTLGRHTVQQTPLPKKRNATEYAAVWFKTAENIRDHSHHVLATLNAFLGCISLLGFSASFLHLTFLGCILGRHCSRHSLLLCSMICLSICWSWASA